jgi:anti-sigma regulatory factor (Ser/Thr protein kinase)
VKICLYEALYNALEHGSLEINGDEKSRLLEDGQQVYRKFLANRLTEERFRDRVIKVNLVISDSELQVAIRDEGHGFDFSGQLDSVVNEESFKSCGRGLLLISSLMDEVTFGDGGREIRMKKLRSSAQA